MNPKLWFRPDSLFKLVDAATWSRGLALFRSQQSVLSLDIEPIDSHWLLLGEVQGSQRFPYELSIEMSFASTGEVRTWDSDCDCPVGSQCKHGVALMLEAAHKGLELLDGHALITPVNRPTPVQLETARQAAQSRADEIARAEAETQLLRWLQDMDRANGVATTEGAPARATNWHAGKTKAEQYLYLLSIAGSNSPKPQLQMDIVVSYLKLNGDWAKSRTVRYPPYPGEATYDRATPVDHEVLQLISTLPRPFNQHYAYSPGICGALHGRAGLIALELAAGTGRLFINNGRGGPAQAVQWGPPQPLRWEWREINNARATETGWALRAMLADTDATLCLNNPPLYLNAAQGRCGLAQADGIPAAQLEVLLRAPPLKSSALQKHQVKLLQRLGNARAFARSCAVWCCTAKTVTRSPIRLTSTIL